MVVERKRLDQEGMGLNPAGHSIHSLPLYGVSLDRVNTSVFVSVKDVKLCSFEGTSLMRTESTKIVSLLLRLETIKPCSASGIRGSVQRKTQMSISE